MTSKYSTANYLVGLLFFGIICIQSLAKAEFDPYISLFTICFFLIAIYNKEDQK